MLPELDFILTITLVFICLMFLITGRQKNIDRQYYDSLEKDEVNHNIPKEKLLKSDEVIDTLDWMLSNGIIDTKEYTKLIGKCLPFLQ